MKSHRAPLNPVEVETQPIRKIAIDIIGELPRTTTGCKFILTIVDYGDYGTRYPEAMINQIKSRCGSSCPVFLQGGNPQRISVGPGF